MEGFPKKIVVTDQEINLSDLTEGQQRYYHDLAKKVVDRYHHIGRDRVVMSLSGPSGSGKSVIAKVLEHILVDQKADFEFHTADLDAFHYPNSYLERTQDSHGTFLKEVKGRYDTYDITKLDKCLQQFVAGESVTFPVYSRTIHEPIEGGWRVERPRALLFIVGLWFLRDDARWEPLRKHFSHNFYLEGSPEKMKKNTVARHMRGGRDVRDAETFYEESDVRNSQEIRLNSVEPDETLIYFENIEDDS